MTDDTPKPLQMVKIFKDAAGGGKTQNQLGYELIDHERVLERVVYSQDYFSSAEKFNDLATGYVRVTMAYDFKAFEVRTVTTLTKQRTSTVVHTDITTKPFSQIENKQAIIDAHRALTELGGTPPPLEDIIRISVKTLRPLEIGPPLQIKAGKGPSEPRP